MKFALRAVLMYYINKEISYAGNNYFFQRNIYDKARR